MMGGLVRRGLAIGLSVAIHGYALWLVADDVLEAAAPKQPTEAVRIEFVPLPEATPPQPPEPESPPEPEAPPEPPPSPPVEEPPPPPPPPPPKPLPKPVEPPPKPVSKPAPRPRPPRPQQAAPAAVSTPAPPQPSAPVGPGPDVRERYLRQIQARIQAHKEYPMAARRRGVVGRVPVHFVLGCDGQVSGLSALDGHALLRESARWAVEAAEPLPRPPPGIDCPIEVRFGMEFRLE